MTTRPEKPKLKKLKQLMSFGIVCVVVAALWPASVSAQPPQWEEGFGRNSTGVPGLDGVDALVVYNGHLHALGRAVGTAVRGLYEWDGTTWILHEFPDPAYRFLRDMVVHDGDLYMSANCGGTGCIQVAKWNGSAFSPVGIANNSVHAIASDGVDLYVGGFFTVIGGAPARHIARWNGANWSEFGGGADDYVGSMYYDGSALYVNGWYHEIGGEPITGVAKWNGASWDSLGSWPREFGSSSPVLKFKGDIYAWIDSWTMGKWNGVTWEEIPMKYIMYSMAEYNNHLYVTFQESGYWLLKWDGTGIPSDYYRFDGYMPTLWPAADKLYVGGHFEHVGDWEIHGVAEWYGESFRVNGCTDDVEDIAMAADGVYAGGSFLQAGTETANYVGRWDGIRWNALGSGMSGPVYTVHSAGNDVYAGGMFTQADSLSVNFIARWDGSQWHPLGGGVSGFVHEIEGTGSELYVGGTFTQAGGVPANYIARWDGANWHPLGGGVSAVVRSIVLDGGELYAGGDFYRAGGMIVKRIARWDGVQWHDLAGGLSGGVFDMEMRYGKLYVAGNFAYAGSEPVNRLAAWDGSSWSDVGGGFGGNVYALAFVGNDLYAGGNFTKATAMGPANNIAKWDGSEWTPLAEGTDGRVTVLAVSAEGLYAGGQFLTAGTVLSEHFGLWTVNTDATGTEAPVSEFTAYLAPNTPNPFNPATTIRYTLGVPAEVTLSVYDVSGRRVRTVVNSVLTPAGEHAVVWDGRDDRGASVVSGVYFCRLEAGGVIQSRKMVLIK